MNIKFDAISIITAFGIAQGYFLSLFTLLRKTGNKKANRAMSILLFCMSTSIILGVIWPTNIYQYIPHIIFVGQPFVFLVGPFIWLYLNYLTIPEYKIKMTTCLVLFPFLINIIVFIPFYIKSSEDKIAHLINYYQGDIITIDLFTWIAAQIHMWIYFFIIWRKVNKYHARMKDNFSSLSEIHLSWVKYIILTGIVSFIIFVPITLATIFGFIHLELERYIFLVVAVMIYLIGYKGYQQNTVPFLADDIDVIEGMETAKKYETSKLSRETASLYRKQIVDFMNSEKLYKNPSLTLNDLATKLALKRNLISQVINDEFGRNFYDFINSFRVEEVKKRLDANRDENSTVLQIAFESGFNSKSSFNAIFKKVTGKTPSEYRKNI